MNVRLNSRQRAMVIIIALLNVYAIIEGVIYQSFWGILLACCSVTALLFCLQIFSKLQELKDAEENDL